jgi:poly(A) polymerase
MTDKQAAITVLNTLREAGFDALLAGGCVRDMLIDRRPKDYDVATSASPGQICKLFRRRIEVGMQFGVVIVMIESHQVEVATFRTDYSYSDGRRPDRVVFTDARADALRRDFTINGMFYDPVAGEVIDYVGGRRDLQARLIRTIGDPRERFGEDYLRMLRAVRFSAELGYQIEACTWSSIKTLAAKIENISGERIAAELERIFACPQRARGIEMLALCDILAVIFPSLTADETSFGIEMLKNLSPPISLEKGLAAMLIKCPKNKAIKMAAPLKLSKKQISAIGWIFDNSPKLLEPGMKLSVLRPLLADERFDTLFDIRKAMQIVEGVSLDNLQTIRERACKLKGIELMPPPLLDGNEIIELGAQRGPQVGSIYRKLYSRQLDEMIQSKDQAIEAVKEWLRGRLK